MDVSNNTMLIYSLSHEIVNNETFFCANDIMSTKYYFERENNDRFYVNVSVINTTNDPIKCNFDKVYQQPILDDPKDYYFTVNRFSISGSGIPLMIMPIQSGSSQTDPNLTTLLFTMTYNNQDFQQFITYVPNNDLGTPSAPAGNATRNYRQLNSDYYFVYSIQCFLDMLNDTLIAIFNDLKAAYPGAPPSEAPYLIFNPESQLISLITQYEYIDNVNPTSISVNVSLYKYLNGFNYFMNSNDTTGKDFTFNLEDTMNNWYAKPADSITSPPAYLQFKQEYVQNYFMSSLQSIVIGTNTIPIQNEIVPTAADANTNPFDNNSMSIITDFVIPLEQLGDTRSLIVYTPTVLRMINFMTENALKRLDFQVYFQDALGNLYPLEVLPGQTCSFKFGFIKRSTYMC